MVPRIASIHYNLSEYTRRQLHCCLLSLFTTYLPFHLRQKQPINKSIFFIGSSPPIRTDFSPQVVTPLSFWVSFHQNRRSLSSWGSASFLLLHCLRRCYLFRVTTPLFVCSLLTHRCESQKRCQSSLFPSLISLSYSARTQMTMFCIERMIDEQKRRREKKRREEWSFRDWRYSLSYSLRDATSTPRYGRDFSSVEQEHDRSLLSPLLPSFSFLLHFQLTYSTDTCCAHYCNKFGPSAWL